MILSTIFDYVLKFLKHVHRETGAFFNRYAYFRILYNPEILKM